RLYGFAKAGRRYSLEGPIEIARVGVLARPDQNTASALGEALQSCCQSLVHAGNIVQDHYAIAVQVGRIHSSRHLVPEREVAVLAGKQRLLNEKAFAAPP